MLNSLKSATAMPGRQRSAGYQALMFVVGLLTPAVTCAAGFSGLASIEDDATLRLRGRQVALWAIHVPRTVTGCEAGLRPVRCASHAALALERVINGFVRCERRGRRTDGATVARCRANYSAFDDGIDLGAYLVNRGWAVAAQDAPADYLLGESIARQHGLGIWGIPFVLDP